MEENTISEKSTVKVVYGKENLKEILTELLERVFVETIKKSEEL